MRSKCSEDAADVEAWPDDADARQALADYMRELGVGSEVQPELVAAFLDMRGARLAGIELSGAEFFGANLESVDLSRACLGKADLRGAELSDANLSESWLMRAEAYECTAQRTKFMAAQLLGADFSHADLRDADLRGAWLYHVRFLKADLRGADLRNAHFGPEDNRTSLGNAWLTGVQVEGASGFVTGAAYVNDDVESLTGSDLESWFHEQGASDVRVLPDPHPGH